MKINRKIVSHAVSSALKRTFPGDTESNEATTESFISSVCSLCLTHRSQMIAQKSSRQFIQQILIDC